MTPIIQIENLAKRYRLTHEAKREKYLTLRESIVSAAVAPWRRLCGKGALSEEEVDFWALKDVSFNVQQGEAVGIIGRNGAGKSTLLKILSRITKPTRGRISVRGRIASLLEVGTGFHPELTGRENIFLNGTILGMGRREIIRNFDEIVAFAEIENFLDTPVKRYSSGMYMRLAFAVAAHLQPEILIVDEVLSVGDAEFQKKCLGKMGEVAKGGRTILFVSHNVSAVQSLCHRAIVLASGCVDFAGASDHAVAHYMSQRSSGNIFLRSTAIPKIGIRFAAIDLSRNRDNWMLTLNAVIQSDRETTATLWVQISDRMGVPIAFGSLGTLDPTSFVSLRKGATHVVGAFGGFEPAIGSYLVSLVLAKPDDFHIDRVENCLEFEMTAAATPPAVRRVQQAWGVGSCQLHSSIVSLQHAVSFESFISEYGRNTVLQQST